jgi:hypothetical protein
LNRTEGSPSKIADITGEILHSRIILGVGFSAEKRRFCPDALLRRSVCKTMIIRKRQNDTFASLAREEFLVRMEKHLRKYFGSVVESLAPEQLRAVVERNWATAETYGLRSELGVCMFLNAVMALGDEFWKSQPKAAQILEDLAVAEEKKRTRLDEWVRAELHKHSVAA